MTFRLSPPPTKYEDSETVAQFYDQLIDRLDAIPEQLPRLVSTIFRSQGAARS